MRRTIAAGIFLLLLAGCNLPAVGTPTSYLPLTATPVFIPTLTPLPTATATLTRTALPTAQPTLSASPSPTTVPTTVVEEKLLCSGGEPVIALLVDPRLAGGIQPGLAQFSADLCAAGYTVRQRALDFANPPALRAYLAQLYALTQRKLTGAILVGEAPRAYQWVVLRSANPKFPDVKEEVLSYQVYTDLDGVFSASAGYRSPGGHAWSYDQHTGNLDWEIWVSLLPIYKGDLARTVEALNRYFAKNHAYRLGQGAVPRAFLQINEHFLAGSPEMDSQLLAEMRSGTFAWKPWSSSPSSRLYFDTQTATLSLAQGYADMARGVADFTVLDAHGWEKASGQLTIEKVESQPLRTTFLWSNGCAVGNLDEPDNFLAAVLYSPASLVLAAKGTTSDSGGMGNNQNGFFGANIAAALGQKRSLGGALLAHVNVPLIAPWSDSREFHFGTVVLLGDGTLQVREK